MDAPSLKWGVIASKKIGSAVERNRAKRRLRALFRQAMDTLKPAAYLLIAKEQIDRVPFDQMVRDFAFALAKCGVSTPHKKVLIGQNNHQNTL